MNEQDSSETPKTSAAASSSESARPECPGALQAGLILTALKSVFYIFLCTFGGALLALFGIVGASEARGDDAVAVVVLAGLGEVALLFIGLLQVVVLAVCAMAWRTCKPFWLWSLIGLSALGFLHGDCFSVVIGVVTIVGAVQALDRSGR
ncbi:MAG: hypothetical protein CMK00_06385 [Planctomycetes bacterium]|jgi:hypothetical protein|nr:hypothetical protein [Planctomycetota bacterium]HJO27710.1 hypothetical protein [Planctomycetota bacterium]